MAEDLSIGVPAHDHDDDHNDDHDHDHEITSDRKQSNFAQKLRFVFPLNFQKRKNWKSSIESNVAVCKLFLW